MRSKLASWPLNGSCREAPQDGRLDAPKQAALLHDLEQLWIDNNLSTKGENHTLISNEYLEVIATRR
jgi:hypothetical protein